MHKNAIKIVWGGQKVCAFYQKYGAFWEKKVRAPICALFGQIRQNYVRLSTLNI